MGREFGESVKEIQGPMELYKTMTIIIKQLKRKKENDMIFVSAYPLLLLAFVE